MRLGLTCVHGIQAVDDAAENINEGIDQAAEGVSEGIDQAREYAEDPTKAVSDAAGGAESGVGQVADVLKAGVRSVSQGAEDALDAAEETAEDARVQSEPLHSLLASAHPKALSMLTRWPWAVPTAVAAGVAVLSRPSVQQLSSRPQMYLLLAVSATRRGAFVTGLRMQPSPTCLL